MTDPALSYWHECLFILRTNLTAEETEAAVEQFKTIVVERGGGVAKVEEMGRRRLAYEIHGEREGLYIDLVFWGGAPVIEELTRVMRIDARVIRHIVIRETKRQHRRRLTDAAKQAEEAAVAEAVAAAGGVPEPVEDESTPAFETEESPVETEAAEAPAVEEAEEAPEAAEAPAVEEAEEAPEADEAAEVEPEDMGAETEKPAEPEDPANDNG